MVGKSRRASMAAGAVAVLTLAMGGFLLLRATENAARLLNEAPPSQPMFGLLGQPWVLRGDRLYWCDSGSRFAQESGRVAVFSQSVNGGPIATLFQQPRSEFCDVLFTRDAILLLTQPAAVKPVPMVTGPNGNPMPIRDVFRAAPTKPPIPDPVVEDAPRSLSRAVPAPTLFRLAYGNASQTPERATLNIDGYSAPEVQARLTESGLCWLRPGTNRERHVYRRDPMKPPFLLNLWPYIEIDPVDTLVLTAWDGKTTELLKNCLAVLVGRDDDRLYYQSLRAWNEDRAVRWEMRRDPPGQPLPIPDLAATGRTNLSPTTPQTRREARPRFASPPLIKPDATVMPAQVIEANRDELLRNGANRLEFGGRYYWFEGPHTGSNGSLFGLPGDRTWQESPFSSAEPPVLVSSVRDGSDRKVVLAMRDTENRPLLPMLLATDGKGLFLHFRRAEPGKTAENAVADFFCRIHPDRPAQFWGKPVRLPEGVYTHDASVHEGAYYYFTLVNKKNTLDFLNERSTDQQVVHLWRVPLPD